jgi:hypothetical protein
MAVALTMNSSEDDKMFSEWIATWPDQTSVEESFPIFWDKQYQILLPRAAQSQ